MSFPTGSISFNRFKVIGQAPNGIDQALLDKLAEHAFRGQEEGVPEDSEYGWSGGDHLYDGEFSFANNVYADALHFALRIDTNKVPGAVRKSYQAMEEQAVAATNPSGFISKLQKRDVKDVVNRKVDEDMRTGRFRRSRLLPILWDVPAGVLYSAAKGSSFEKLAEIFERTFGLSLSPVTSGNKALDILEPLSRRRDYEDLRPSRFVSSPVGAEGEYPEYPWVAKGPEPKDFLGNEFLLWLWYEADAKNGVIDIGQGNGATVFFDRSLELHCAYGQTGAEAIKGDGPTRMPESRIALATGKVPRRAGMILDANGMQFTLTLIAEGLGISGCKLPEVEEADTPRVLFEERIGLLRTFSTALDRMFGAFITERASSKWSGVVSDISKWIGSRKPKSAAA